MAGKRYVLDNFRIGENVVPLIQQKLKFVVTDIDKEHGLIICRMPGMSEVIYKFKPYELEKEILLPPDTVGSADE